MVLDAVLVEVLHDVGDRYRECLLKAGVGIVRCLGPDAEGGVGFVVEDGGGLQGAVGIDGEQVVVGGAVAFDEGECVGGVGVGIGGVELAHDGSRGQILGDCGSVQVDRSWRGVRNEGRPVVVPMGIRREGRVDQALVGVGPAGTCS